MPKVWKYKPTSKKYGYYIRANVGGSHPVTLQVTDIAENILRQTGHKPKQSISTKLVWAMYDLDLLYTNKSIDIDNIKEVPTQDVLRKLDLGNKLSEHKKQQIISYIENYNGSQKSDLDKLKKELNETVSTVNNEQQKTTKFDAEIVPETADEAVAQLYTLAKNVDKYRETQRARGKAYLLQSLQTFSLHPHANSTSAHVTNDYLLCYPLYQPDGGREYWLTDHRDQTIPHKHKNVDYVIRWSDDSKGGEVVVGSGDVIEHTSSESERYSFEKLVSDLDWILPQGSVELNKVDYSTEDETKYDGFTEYDGRLLRPIHYVENIESIDVEIVEVDRISNNGNPVVEIDQSQHILDKGETGEEYLVEDTGRTKWKVLSIVL